MAEEIGVAYLAVKPKVDGSFESEMSKAGSTAGNGFGGAFQVAAGNLITNAVNAIAGTVTDTFKDAFNNYAMFEQLKGGVKSIFNEADIDGIMGDANRAYKELNMSANEYLESINQTGAAFAQTMGDQKGYDTARTGMMAISDYASGTGRDLNELNEKFALITRATSSYQSIADQFSGILPATSADFLSQAQAAGFLSSEYSKLTDVPVAEYQEAVSKMLQKGVSDMGLAGNTAKESTATISGSLAMLSGAWQNFLTGVFDENADLGVLGENLFNSIGAVLQNVLPRVGYAISNLVLSLPGMITGALQMLPTLLEPVITSIFGEQMGGQINGIFSDTFGQVAETLTVAGTNLGVLFTTMYGVIQPIITMLGSIFAAVMPVIQTALAIVVDFVINSVIPTVNDVLATVQPVIEQIAASIAEKMPQIQAIMQKVMGIIKKVIDTVWPHVRNIIQAAMTVISQVISTAWPIISAMIDSAMTTISGIIDVAWPAIQTIIETVSNAIQSVTDTVWPIISGIVETAAGAIKSAIESIESVVGVVRDIFESVKSFIEDPIGEAKNFVEGIINDIENAFAWMDIDIPAPKLPHINWHWHNLLGDFGGISIPVFDGIEWYAKGGMVDGAQLIGAGEKGAELIWPSYDPYLTKYADAIADRMGGRGGVDIHDCTFNVRNDGDIRRIANELNQLINRQTVGGYA